MALPEVYLPWSSKYNVPFFRGCYHCFIKLIFSSHCWALPLPCKIYSTIFLGEYYSTTQLQEHSLLWIQNVITKYSLTQNFCAIFCWMKHASRFGAIVERVINIAIREEVSLKGILFRAEINIVLCLRAKYCYVRRH